ncbi:MULTISPECIES: prolipoprotein diacylglyceryl transferase [Gordonia]|uniref:prolipoprotein diacylglyceryl transferase n=1 Tax=Gordonia TaxID=2053 RepID=UPI00257DEFEA|nr:MULTISPECIES: prolipoprotein diacylglyceryl transferase [Gordonia]
MLAYIPSPPQGVWYIGSFPLRAYALCIIVGIIVAVWWGNRRWIARGGRSGEVLDVAIWAVPFGLIGGRVYHVLTDWQIYFGDGGKTPIDAFKIWDGGLGIWGAVLFGGLGAWIGTRRMGIKLPPFADAIAPAILLAQAIGRLGNYFNQELYGRPTDVPWGLEIYERVDSSGQADPGLITGVSNGHVVAVVHPTFLYELLWNLLVVVILVLVDRYFRIGHGRLFALYVVGYCIGRFGVELMRSDPAFTHIAGVRINVFTAALGIVCGAIYFIVAPRGREQGLEVYWPERAAELEELGHTGAYFDDDIDDDIDDEDDGEHFFDDDDDESDDEESENDETEKNQTEKDRVDNGVADREESDDSSSKAIAAAGVAAGAVAVGGVAAATADDEPSDGSVTEPDADEASVGVGEADVEEVDDADVDEADADAEKAGADADVEQDGVDSEPVDADGEAEATDVGDDVESDAGDTETDSRAATDSDAAPDPDAEGDPETEGDSDTEPDSDADPDEHTPARDEAVEDGGDSAPTESAATESDATETDATKSGVTQAGDAESGAAEPAGSDAADDPTDEGIPMSSAEDEAVTADEIAEGLSEDIEDNADDEGDTSPSGVDEDEAELADGQEINAGGPDPVLDENEEIVSKIIPGTGESADAKPWNPENDPARPDGVITESELLDESDSESDTTPGDTADIDAEEVAEGIAEDAEASADDDGAATAEGVDEAEEVLADGQMTNAGGPDAVVDENEEIDAKIIPGTGESADAKPWKPGDAQ